MAGTGVVPGRAVMDWPDGAVGVRGLTFAGAMMEETAGVVRGALLVGTEKPNMRFGRRDLTVA
jgi:hypothetical protein